jgi:glycosyltransferase involved in cell wall biosynthesis
MLDTLSIVIPTYRRSEKLPQLLESLVPQTLRPQEILIIDQNPEQKTPDWFSEFAAKLPLKIEFLAEPNASSARNLGFKKSCGDVVLFVDDDLVAGKDFCERGMQRLREFPNEVHCLCPVILVGGRITGTEMIDTNSAGPVADLVKLKNSITAAVFFERQYFKETGGFDEHLFRFARTAEDQELFLRMLRRGMEFWLDQSLFIDHDENVPGGCELRSGDYWKSRERCINSWALRYRIHAKCAGRLTARDLYRLFRSAVLNRGVMTSGPLSATKNFLIFLKSIRKSSLAFQGYKSGYQNVTSVDHLM